MYYYSKKWSSQMYYWDSKIHQKLSNNIQIVIKTFQHYFSLPGFTEISRSSNIVQALKDLMKFQDMDFPFIPKPSLKPIVFDPATI